MTISTSSIETATGRFIDLIDPQPEQVDITDIAWAGSRMPRYAGHTLGRLAYSVNQHSVHCTKLVVELKEMKNAELVSSFVEYCNLKSRDTPTLAMAILREVGAKDLLHVLLHDASESYLMDIPTPLKRAPGMKEAYAPIERRMMETIWTRFDLEPPTPRQELLIGWADAYALKIEAYHMMPSRGQSWAHMLPLPISSIQDFEGPKEPMDVHRDFMSWFNELRHDAALTQ
jgi:hypothetical protein